jgi:hypothetical protein
MTYHALNEAALNDYLCGRPAGAGRFSCGSEFAVKGRCLWASERHNQRLTRARKKRLKKLYSVTIIAVQI